MDDEVELGIYVQDFLGTSWKFAVDFTYRRQKSSKGLHELWFWILGRGPDRPLEKYLAIPVPVFTDWWPTV